VSGVPAYRPGPAFPLGKIPSQPEYLPTSIGAAFVAFDAWVTEATEWAALRGGPAWSSRFASGALHAFAFRSPSEPSALLCGALGPSRDSVGRQFPLVLAAPLSASPAMLEQPQLLPFFVEGLWSSSTSRLWELLTERTADAQAACAGLQLQPSLELEEASALYVSWSQDLELAELWSLLGPAFEGSGAEQRLRLLAATLLPVRGQERPCTPLSLRLPLGLAGGPTLCFWLDVVRLLNGWHATIPSLFWSHDGQSGVTLLHLGTPPKEALCELWQPTGERQHISDLTLTPDRALLDALPPLSPSLRAVLNEPGARASDLLVELGRAGDSS
jgi:type VI secretion system ImpM family protein